MSALPLKRENLADQITPLLRQEIFSGDYEVGQSLPSEHKLSEIFGASRITIRNALHTLIQEGWIESIQGKGNIVKEFKFSLGLDVLPEILNISPEILQNPNILNTLTSFFLWYTSQLHMAVSENITVDDKERLIEIIESLKPAMSLQERWAVDFAYERALVEIADNLMLNMFYNTYESIVRKTLEIGVLKDLAYPVDQWIAINMSLIEADLNKDKEKLTALIESFREDIKAAVSRMFA